MTKFTDNNNKMYEIEFIEIHDKFNGIIQGSFELRVLKPFLAASKFVSGDIRKKEGIKGINFYKNTDVAIAACKLQNRTKQDVLFSLSPNAIKYINDCTEAAIQELKKQAETRTIKNWVWAIGGDTGKLYISTDDISSIEKRMRPVLTSIEYYIENNQHRIENLEKYSHKCSRDTALYAPDGWNVISNDDLMTIYNQLKSEDTLQEQQKEDTTKHIFEMAKQTGEKQIIRQWSEECNDPREECDIDNIIEYAMPDGSTKTERYHSW